MGEDRSEAAGTEANLSVSPSSPTSAASASSPAARGEDGTAERQRADGRSGEAPRRGHDQPRRPEDCRADDGTDTDGERVHAPERPL
jgi:hypothetical protein